MDHQHAGKAENGSHHAQQHYGRLGAMAALSFFTMYALMYAMVDAPGNVYANLNQFYMAALMVAPMVLIELLLMRHLYANKAINAAIVAGSMLVAAACWLAIRHQAAISDQQFVRSMIPHHAGAILMCQRNRLHSSDLQALCRRIVASQQSEIDLMKAHIDD